MKNLSDGYSRVVRFGETDAGGVVYFAELLGFCHEAYEDGLAVAGVDVRAFFSGKGTDLTKRKYAVAVPIVHVQADFYRPMFCGDRITISLTPKLLTPDSFEVAYKVFGSGESATDRVAEALTRHVAIRTDNRRRCPLPDYLTNWIAAQSEPLEPI